MMRFSAWIRSPSRTGIRPRNEGAPKSVLSGSSNRVDLVGTAGLRTEHRFNRMALAGAFDLVNEPLRATPFGWQASVQIIIRTDAAARAARQAKRPIRYEEAP